MSTTSASLPDNASAVLGPPLLRVMYLTNSRQNDGSFLRGIVHFLFLLDTAQTFMIMDDAFFWFVYHFGDYSALFDHNLASISGPFLDAIITLTVQLVYCWRLWKLGKRRVLPIISAAVSFNFSANLQRWIMYDVQLASISCISGMTTGIHSILDPKHSDKTSQNPILKEINLWLISAAVADILIASSMTYLLVKYKKEGVVAKSTLAVVKRILILTLETSAVTAAVAIALVASFLVPSLAHPNTTVYIALGYTIGKL
ncbi:hypothetical protein NP233_g6655 [Leucocoprinus birnbaumii]|uniref:DUF6534 domain-containing protein n=1 Tax=Leucocoprinus birnbaumii TaxID=56174 RepID=A0AAD5VW79_9AGAR|nr:hypothetical protein NP233_g6655 [Leucocoprinus birnbaumii]